VEDGCERIPRRGWNMKSEEILRVVRRDMHTGKGVKQPLPPREELLPRPVRMVVTATFDITWRGTQRGLYEILNKLELPSSTSLRYILEDIFERTCKDEAAALLKMHLHKVDTVR
jgi:hypothetical protein